MRHTYEGDPGFAALPTFAVMAALGATDAVHMRSFLPSFNHVRAGCWLALLLLALLMMLQLLVTDVSATSDHSTLDASVPAMSDASHALSLKIITKAADTRDTE